MDKVVHLNGSIADIPVHGRKPMPAWWVYPMVVLNGLAAFCLWPLVQAYFLATDDRLALYRRDVTSRAKESVLIAVAIVSWIVIVWGLVEHISFLYVGIAGVFYLYATFFRYHPENKPVRHTGSRQWEDDEEGPLELLKEIGALIFLFFFMWAVMLGDTWFAGQVDNYKTWRDTKAELALGISGAITFCGMLSPFFLVLVLGRGAAWWWLELPFFLGHVAGLVRFFSDRD